MTKIDRSRVALMLPVLLLAGMGLTGCNPDGGGSSSGPPTSAPTAAFNLAGIWQDTDVVVSNTCDSPQPVVGESRVTDGIVIAQADSEITLTAPVNALGTQTIATGTLSGDGTLTLTGTDSGTTITLTYHALSDTEIVGDSEVDTGDCIFYFTNSLVKTAEPE